MSKSAKAKSNGKAATKTVAKKVVKAAPAKVVVGDTAASRVYKVKKPFPSGVRAEFTSAIPKAGAPLGVIAKKTGVGLAKARSYAYWLASNGYLTRVAA